MWFLHSCPEEIRRGTVHDPLCRTHHGLQFVHEYISLLYSISYIQYGEGSPQTLRSMPSRLPTQSDKRALHLDLTPPRHILQMRHQNQQLLPEEMKLAEERGPPPVKTLHGSHCPAFSPFLAPFAAPQNARGSSSCMQLSRCMQDES